MENYCMEVQFAERLTEQFVDDIKGGIFCSFIEERYEI